MSGQRLPFDALARSVAEVGGLPVDAAGCAVLLEVVGVTQRQARSLGCTDLFDLAARVRPLVAAYVPSGPPAGNPPRIERTRFGGLFYYSNWIVMVAAVVIGRQSLWSARDVPPEVATGLTLAVVGALVSTGGIQQFAAMRLTYYRLQNNRPLERFVMSRAVLLGLPLAIAVVALVSVASQSILLLPADTVIVVAVYGCLIGIARLLAIPPLARKSFGEILFVPLVAVGLMFFVFRYLEPLTDRTSAVLISQLVGLVVLDLVGVALVARYFARSAQRAPGPADPPFYAQAEAPRNVHAPRMWSLIVAGTSHLIYGTMFFVFLYTDRILSWARSADGAYLLAYNNKYQLGVDLALLPLVPIMVAKYPVIANLIDELLDLSYKTAIAAEGKMSRCAQRLIAATMLRVTAVAAIFCGSAFAAATPLILFAGGDEEIASVFRYGVLGVFFLAVFLANAVIAMNLNWTMHMAALLFVGTLCDLIVGWTAASRFGVNASVAGFVAGSLFLALASTFMLLNRRSLLVYSLYAAE